MDKIVLLDRATIAPQIKVRRPKFEHHYAEHAQSASDERRRMWHGLPTRRSRRRPIS